MGANPQNQPAGPDSGEAFEAGESEGPEDDGPEEMEAGGFDVPELIDRVAAPDAPDAPDALDAPDAPDAPDIPDTSDIPPSGSDDDLQ